MVRRIFVLLIMLAVMVLFTYLGDQDSIKSLSPTLILGTLLLAAYSLGFVLDKIKLPKITAYIVAGLLFGPYLIDFISDDSINDLSFINSLALSFIAFCAGGELKLTNIRNRLKTIIYLSITQTFIVFFGVSIIVFFLLDQIPFFSDLVFVQRLIVSLIFGVISVARSPSSTIAIISETKAKGAYTDVVLSVTVLIDVVVIILFGITISFCQVLAATDAPVDWLFFLFLMFEILVALVLGFILGKGIIFLIESVKVEFPIVILGIGFLVIKFSHLFTDYMRETYDIAVNLEPLLICMAAGFTIQNFSNYGRRFLVKMENISLPIYIVFFTITGASINLGVLKESWLFGIIIVVVRVVMLFAATMVSGVISKDEPLLYKNYWLAFLTQAGVSLGLLTEVVRRFPAVGVPVQSLLIAAITINQLIGPVALKYALTKVGDAGRK